jgi:hypothetical protein
MSRLCAFLALLAIGLPAISGQQQGSGPQPAHKSAPANDKFSGTIRDLTADSVTVVQIVPARDAVVRKFSLDSQTKVEGRLRLNARVTVQYASGEEGQLRAVHIIVR